ncbi:transcriptional regulator [Clostridium beijerinckii]|uniref:Transcriptional regulator n=2 Tax=Clostridium TaxID=1485 RepID=A0A0B5QUM3_CLOBE|nr:YafY family protein [Clostridium beijerinckii]AJH00609.1 transcriptional regulator [Clostridium beijerinckii]MBE6090158.1 YafY family transcriptional regulator [Clostridium beijerinckii]
MKKSERLNHMMMYLNDFDYFNLSDLINKYNISRSTALRDIASLEELGMPIYAEQGRYGRYVILKNRLLSPIIFTIDEVYALYFAMLTLKAYESTPFHLSIEKLNEKFENCLSGEQIKEINKMKKVLKFEASKHNSVSQFLDKILESIINEISCKIKYLKNNKTVNYHIQFFEISSKFGQWYASGIELKSNKYKVFRCDKMISLEFSNDKLEFPIEKLINSPLEFYQSYKSIQFEIEILDSAKDIFYKENYPSMKIELGTKTIIKGFFNVGEEEFISDYFLRYGTSIKSVKPQSLKSIIYEKIKKILNHYEEI